MKASLAPRPALTFPAGFERAGLASRMPPVPAPRPGLLGRRTGLQGGRPTLGLLVDRNPRPAGRTRRWPRSSGASRQPAAAPGDAPALTFRSAAPNPMLDVVLERVLQARPLNGALGAIVARNLDSDSVAREKDLGRQVPASSLSHPRSFQLDLRPALRHTLNVLRSPAGLWIPAGLKPQSECGEGRSMTSSTVPNRPMSSRYPPVLLRKHTELRAGSKRAALRHRSL